jgi:hypothetical protein
MSDKLVEFFNKQPRIGALSTSNKEGKVNVAYFGSPFMADEKTVEVGLTQNRSFTYLQENPFAAFIIMEPGASLPEWKGVRLYMKMTDCQTSGEKLDAVKARITAGAGEGAAKMIHAAITFEVLEIRPLADFGQGWEESI